MSNPSLSAVNAKQQILTLHQQGVSIRAIARAVGMGKSTVHDVVKGKYSLSARSAEQVGNKLSKYGGMRILTDSGFQVVFPRTTRDISLLGKHARAMQVYLDTGISTMLQQLAGKSVKTTSGTYPLLCDTAQIKALAKSSALDVEEIYIGGSPGGKRRR